MPICRIVSRHGEEKGTCVCSDVYMPPRPTLQNQIKVQDSVSSNATICRKHVENKKEKCKYICLCMTNCL